MYVAIVAAYWFLCQQIEEAFRTSGSANGGGSAAVPRGTNGTVCVLLVGCHVWLCIVFDELSTLINRRQLFRETNAVHQALSGLLGMRRIVLVRLYLPVQAASSSSITGSIAALRDMCECTGASSGEVALSELTSLVTACTPALCSPEVATALCAAVRKICSNSSAKANRVVCGAAGAIHAVIAVLSTHGASSTIITVDGCTALSCVAQRNDSNAEAIVSGLDVILFLMTMYDWDEDVQEAACLVLWTLAVYVSGKALTAIRRRSVSALLNTAKASHPSNTDLQAYADKALDAIAPRSSDSDSDADVRVSTPVPVRYHAFCMLKLILIVTSTYL